MKASLKELLIHILGVDFRYPVGSYYETSNANFDPNTAWGGTWVQDSAGRVIVAYDSGISAFDTIGETGGSKDAIVPKHSHSYSYAKAATDGHTLTVNQIPSHRHASIMNQVGSGDYFTIVNAVRTGGSSAYAYGGYAGGGQAHSHNIGTRSGTTEESGSSVTDANLQPYTVAYRWHRIA